MSGVSIRSKQASSMPSVSKLVLFGSIAFVLNAFADGTASAEWRTPLSGTPLVLPSRFVPMRYVMRPIEPVEILEAPARPATADVPFRFSLPLVDRHLSLADKAEPLASDLRDAILRIEPLYDSTRLDGPEADQGLVISSGTATMDDVFADHWHAVSADPNVNRKVPYIAMAWTRMPTISCDAFTKNRTHGFGDTALSSLTAEDCSALSSRQRIGLDRPLLLATARNSVPVFAAPLPGSRLTSADFWSAQHARIAAIQAHLRRKWEPLGLRDAVAEPIP